MIKVTRYGIAFAVLAIISTYLKKNLKIITKNNMKPKGIHRLVYNAGNTLQTRTFKGSFDKWQLMEPNISSHFGTKHVQIY